MLFRKYHIVIFKEGQGDCRNILMRGWFGAGLFLLIAALAGGNMYFFKYFAKSKSLENQLVQSERVIEEQNTQLLNLTGKLRNVQADMTRVQQFNSKLRAMMSLDREPIVAKPLSFMNASGEVVSKLANFYKIPPFGLFVVHDDVDLPLQKIKIVIDRGSAGHKGVESIIQKLGSKNFVRVRVGVGGNKKIEADRLVLQPFGIFEKARLGKTIKKAVEAIEQILKEGAEKGGQ